MRFEDEPPRRLRPLRSYLKLCILVLWVAAGPTTAPICYANSLIPDGENFDNVENLLQEIGRAGPIWEIAWNPTGRTLASGAEDGTVTLWDVLEGKQIRSLRELSESIVSLSFNSAGSKLAAASDQGLIAIWDLDTLETLPPFSGGWSVAFNPQSELLASGLSNGDIYFWDPESGKKVLEIDRGHLDRVSTIAWSPDGTKLASGSWDRTIKLWDGGTRNLLHRFEGHENRVTSISWSADSQYLASASLDGKIRVWDIEAGHEVRIFEGHTSAVHAVAWRPDAPILASSSRDATIRVWHLLEQKEIALLDRRHQAAILDVAFSPQGTMLASASADGTISISASSLNLSVPYNDVEIRRFSQQAKSVSAVALDENGHTLAAATKSDSIHLWKLQRGHDTSSDPMEGPKEIAIEGRKHLTAIALGPPGNVLAVGFEDGSIHLWSSKDTTWKSFGVLPPIIAHDAPVTALAFSADGRILASGSSDLVSGQEAKFAQRIKLWNWLPEDRREISTLQTTHADKITSLAFSADGRLLASGSNDRTVHAVLWRENREITAPIELKDRVQWIGFTAEGFLLISLANGTISTWSPIHGSLKIVHVWRERLHTLAFAAKSRTILSVVGSQSLLRIETTSNSGNYIPSRLLLLGQGDNWIHCGTEGRCWRNDDGNLALRRDTTTGELRTLPPLVSPGPRLEITKIIPEVQVADGELVSFDVEVHNYGPGIAFWVNVTHAIPASDHPVIFYSPPTFPVLEAGGSVIFKCRLALHTSYENPQSGRLPLDLRVSSAQFETVANGLLHVSNTLPYLAWKGSRLTATESEIEIAVANRGTEVFRGDYFTAKANDVEVGPIAIENKAGWQPGEDMKLTFKLPDGLNGRSIDKIDVAIYQNGAFPHRWTFRDNELDKYLISYRYLIVVSSGVFLVLVVLGIRLFFRARRSTELQRWAGRRRQVTLAIVFTDIIKSTELVNRLDGFEWASVRNIHFEQVRRLTGQYGGYEVRSTGDGMMIVFRNAVDALHFALGLERSTGHRLIRVRAGIHIGQVEIDRDDVHGKVVHMAARITDMAKDGGVWISEPLRRDYLEMYGESSSYHWTEHSECELKGFGGGRKLWSVSS